MITLVYDTETTGLPPKGSTSLDAMPYIVQLAAILYNGRKPVAHFSTYIEPAHKGKGRETPDEKFFIDAGLTKADMLPTRMPLELSLMMFNHFLKLADRTVAHNARFDKGRLEDSYTRLFNTIPVPWTTTPHYCTMLTLEPILKLPAKWGKGYKWPNLDEAYRAYVDPNGFSGAHDAMIDVTACADVLFAIETQEVELVRV